MKLIAQLKLQPSPSQAAALLDTLVRANQAANFISRTAWETRTFANFALHKLLYATLRASSGLSAQLVVRLLARVAHAYKRDPRDRKIMRRFRQHSSIAYDARILSWHDGAVSIWTTSGRQYIPFVAGERNLALLQSRQGESDLVYRGGAWYLYATCNVAEPTPSERGDYLGVDLGVVNVAVDSNGTVYSGSHLRGLRHRQRRLRAKLQAKGTRAAKRLLRARRRKEARFGASVNHTISKRIVATAKAQSCGIALEDLKGIRERITVRHGQRATLHSWSFYQLRQFLSYKARLAGVRLVLVDPRNTSRTCPDCGHVDKKNRTSQSTFKCVSCGHAGLADQIAAENIRRAARKPAVLGGSLRAAS
jgi:IS605 OrfB family transposase